MQPECSWLPFLVLNARSQIKFKLKTALFHILSAVRVVVFRVYGGVKTVHDPESHVLGPRITRQNGGGSPPGLSHGRTSMLIKISVVFST